MAAHKKTSFYHTRWNHVGVNQAKAAEILGVTVEDVERFDKEGAPVMAERLLLLWDQKHVGIDGWNGWLFSRGVLRYGRKQWTPAAILAARDAINENEELRQELKQIKSWQGIVSTAKSLLKSDRKAADKRL